MPSHTPEKRSCARGAPTVGGRTMRSAIRYERRLDPRPSSTRALSCLLVGSNDPREHKVPERLIATGRPSSPPRIGGWTEAPTLGLASLWQGPAAATSPPPLAGRSA